MIRLSVFAVILAAGLPIATSAATSRPMIWVTPADRPTILEKIQNQTWARTAFEAMQERVRDAVARHEKNPDAFLRGLPLVPDAGHPQSHPTLAHIGGNMASEGDKEVRGVLQGYLLNGVDCGVLYYLTGEEKYARCAADILQATVEALVRMPPNENVGNGGWIYPDDHLYEARALGAQLPLIYDFVQSYLKKGATVHSLVDRKPTAFNFEHAQQVFRTYARLAIEHGIIDANWPVLEMPSLTHNILALDDPEERTRLLAHVLDLDTPHQDSLKKVVSEYAAPGSVWPESFQYSSGVSALSTYLVALLRRQQPPMPLPAAYRNIPLSLARLQDMRFPNGEYLRVGDGPRKGGGAYSSYEIAYALSLREGDAQMQATFGGLINLGIAQGNYDRGKALGQTRGASVYLGPLQLLWYAPAIQGEMTAPRPRTTDELPFAGVVLQRNLSANGDPTDALMAVVSGGRYVHSHASGMALELYGIGEVLGANAGKGTYTTDEHENYRRLFAAYNTVIVNGATRSGGGWANLGINPVETVALEPAVGTAPVSPFHSFSVTRFLDDKGPGALAKQQRLVGIVRTSDKTGYYVDVFRSESSLPDQFHDYLYHNIGDSLTLSSDQSPLTLNPSPDRFVPVQGAAWSRNRSYLFPGWHVFKNVRTSAPIGGDIQADFALPKLAPRPAHMRLFVPGQEGREYSTALAPATKDAPQPYDHKPTPVLVIRQHGQAWTRPIAVIYEPVAGANPTGSIQSVDALTSSGKFAGFKVISKIAGQTNTQYILIQPNPADHYEDPALGISFQGRYAVISLNEKNECTSLYLGEGTRLRFQQYALNTLSDNPSAAYAEIAGPHSILKAHHPVEFVFPDGTRLTARSDQSSASVPSGDP
jgi:hypothetical protein